MSSRFPNPKNILFLDIETVPQVAHFDQWPQDTAALFDKKTKWKRGPEETAQDAFDQAGILAEFGKIVCISFGMVDPDSDVPIKVASYSGHEEKELLEMFARFIDARMPSKFVALCGHNAKEFDIPFICRRMVVHGITLPETLSIHGKKPWEIPHLDTMELWKFGDYKHFTSLALMAHIFGIPTPKDDIDGSQVASVYWNDGDLDRITRYCEKDVEALIKVYLHLVQHPLRARLVDSMPSGESVTGPSNPVQSIEGKPMQ